MNYPNFELRINTDNYKVRLGIYDGREAFIATVDFDSAGKSPFLWTNNPQMIHVLTHFCETKWALARDFPSELPVESLVSV